MAVKPTTPVPALDLPLSAGGRFNIAEQRPDTFTVVVFYRGLHCPKCKDQLQELAARWTEFREAGAHLVAISCDDADRAARAREEWALGDLPVAYGLGIDEARLWGLFISDAVKEDEPAQFCEPGIFLVQPTGALYASMVNTMPFARPRVEDLLSAIRFVSEKGYPARGGA